VLLAVIRRRTGWDPPSLWLDDEWVGIAVHNTSLGQLYNLHLPSPFGFTLLAKVASSIGSDPEWPLQILPFLAGLAIVPLCYVVLRLIVRRVEVVALVCLVAVCHPTVELYAVRIKHYTLDVVVALVLWKLFLEFRLRPSASRLAGFVAASLIAPVFSFSSLLVSTAAIHGLAIDRMWPCTPPVDARETKQALTAAAVFDLGVALLYATLLAGQSNPAMKEFWHKHFILFDRPATWLDFAWRGLLNTPINAASLWFVVLLWPLGLGIAHAIRSPLLRPLALAFGLLFALQLAAAALRVYPMGDARTGMYAYPLYWILIAIGLESAFDRAKRPTFQTFALRFVAVWVVLAAICRPTVVYSEARDRQAVQRMRELQKPGDGILVHHTGLLALSYYGGSPLEIVPFADVCHGFKATPAYADLFVLPMQIGGVALRDRTELVRTALQPFYEHNYPRVLFLSTHATPNLDQKVLEDCSRHGYRRSATYVESVRAAVYVLEREQPARRLRAIARSSTGRSQTPPK
jgi:hypothetical protein